ncbi:hypothetical protein ACVIN2_003670 [Bradyrhizobium sp. USDA 3650]
MTSKNPPVILSARASLLRPRFFSGLTAAESAAVIRLPTICDEYRSSRYQDNPQPIEDR